MAIPLALGYFCSTFSRGKATVRPTFRDWFLWLASRDASRALLAGFAVVLMGVSLSLTLSRSGMLSLAVALIVCSYAAVRRQSGTLGRSAIFGCLMLSPLVIVVWREPMRSSTRFAALDTMSARRAAPDLADQHADDWGFLAGRIGPEHVRRRDVVLPGRRSQPPSPAGAQRLSSVRSRGRRRPDSLAVLAAIIAFALTVRRGSVGKRSDVLDTARCRVRHHRHRRAVARRIQPPDARQRGIVRDAGSHRPASRRAARLLRFRSRLTHRTPPVHWPGGPKSPVTTKMPHVPAGRRCPPAVRAPTFDRHFASCLTAVPPTAFEGRPNWFEHPLWARLSERRTVDSGEQLLAGQGFQGECGACPVCVPLQHDVVESRRHDDGYPRDRRPALSASCSPL